MGGCHSRRLRTGSGSRLTQDEYAELSKAQLELYLALYLIGSVLAVFDFKPLGSSEIAVRLFAALLLVMAWPLVYGAGLALTLAILVLHHRAVRVIPA